MEIKYQFQITFEDESDKLPLNKINELDKINFQGATYITIWSVKCKSKNCNKNVLCQYTKCVKLHIPTAIHLTTKRLKSVFFFHSLNKDSFIGESDIILFNNQSKNMSKTTKILPVNQVQMKSIQKK